MDGSPELGLLEYFTETRYKMWWGRVCSATGEISPSGDRILDSYRFTNVFRVTDRVSQALLRVQRRGGDAEEVVMRTLLFKVFNSEKTWGFLEPRGLTEGWDPDGMKSALDDMKGPRFNGAYMMANPLMGGQKKHHFYVGVLDRVRRYHLSSILSAKDLRELYERLLEVPGFGRFLAYQYATDLNYSEIFRFPEESTVVAGPGAIRGVRKLYGSVRKPEDKIRELHAYMREHGPRLLGELPMQLIDVQNVLCEYDKYTRVLHEEGGRMKERFTPDRRPLPDLMLPSWWGAS